MSNLIGAKILLGFEMGTGKDVHMEAHHTVITGITQLSGKTTTMEGVVERSGARAIVFLTKRGESGFRGQHELKPYFKEQKKAGSIIDWQYVEAILVAVMDEDMKFPRPWIIKVCNGFTPRGKNDTPIPPAHSLEEVYHNIKIAKANPSTHGIDDGIWTQLEAYFEIILPQIKKWDFAEDLKLQKGFNVFNLIGMADEMQHLVIESVISYILAHLNNTIVILPEAHKFIPQGKNTPVKSTAQRFIREGATNGDFLFVDSQETTSVDKAILKQCSNWIMGYQQEKNEVANVRENLGKWNITDEQIMTLQIGHFMVSLQQKTAHIYALPAGVDPELARRVALGDNDAFEEIRKILNGRRQMPVETMPEASPEKSTPIHQQTLISPRTVEEMEDLRRELTRATEEKDILEDEKLNLIGERFELGVIIEGKDAYIDHLHEDLKRAGDKVDGFESRIDNLRTLLFPDGAPVSVTTTFSNGITKADVEDIIDKRISRMSKGQVRSASSSTGVPWVDLWMDKLQNDTQRKLLKYLSERFPVVLTKSDIAIGCGYVATGGSFNGNLNKLVKWGLVNKTAVGYKLAQAPPGVG